MLEIEIVIALIALAGLGFVAGYIVGVGTSDHCPRGAGVDAEKSNKYINNYLNECDARWNAVPWNNDGLQYPKYPHRPAPKHPKPPAPPPPRRSKANLG